jgi:hypothetical protein
VVSTPSAEKCRNKLILLNNQQKKLGRSGTKRIMGCNDGDLLVAFRQFSDFFHP